MPDAGRNSTAAEQAATAFLQECARESEAHFAGWAEAVAQCAERIGRRGQSFRRIIAGSPAPQIVLMGGVLATGLFAAKDALQNRAYLGVLTATLDRIVGGATADNAWFGRYVSRLINPAADGAPTAHVAVVMLEQFGIGSAREDDALLDVPSFQAAAAALLLAMPILPWWKTFVADNEITA